MIIMIIINIIFMIFIIIMIIVNRNTFELEKKELKIRIKYV